MGKKEHWSLAEEEFQMADDAYEVVGGSLKLKGVSSGGIKKKKKKNKIKKMFLEQPKKLDTSTSEETSENSDGVSSSSKTKDMRTAAQIAYDRAQEKRAAERILSKASQSHKERVAEFNTKLDQLTEHYDIPKVSWTK